jgi:uncharacterized repeat protein (TIGR02543 family)
MKDMKKFRWFSCLLVASIVLLTGFNEVCAEQVVVTVFNGVCGSSSGQTFTVAPDTNLCAVGTESVVSGSGPWFWRCDGTGGNGIDQLPTDAHCSAYMPYTQSTILLPRTGQIKCYGPPNVDTGIIEESDCPETGQDGEKLMGAAQTDPLFTENETTITDKVYGMTWQKDAAKNGASIPMGIAVPSTRFTNNYDGTLTDNMTGLIWLKNANCANATSDWQNAISNILPEARGLSRPGLINSLNATGLMNENDCGDISNSGSYQTDWRLPNINELASLPTNYSTEANPVINPSDWLNTQGFINVQPFLYWSSTSYFGPHSAWGVYMGVGGVDHRFKYDSYYVWPVRGGQSGTLDVLTVNTAGTGSGSISSLPAGISCGTTCMSRFDKEQVVVLTATPTPLSSDQTFTSWSGCVVEDPSRPNECKVTVSGVKSVTATFTINKYTVSFNSGQGGSTVEALPNIPYNGYATKPANPTKDGHTFAGWYPTIGLSNGGLNPAFDFAEPIKGNKTLYANWTINNYTVSFVTGEGGSEVSSQSIKYNTSATVPTVPTRSDYAFSGWYDSETDLPFSFTTPITKNKTLYAKWTYNLFSVTPSAGNNSSISPATVQNKLGGSTASFTILPTVPGYGVYATGCNSGTISGNIYTTGAITGNCTVTVTAVKRNGNGGTSISPSVADALKALQAYYGGTSLSAADLIRYDVAPVVDGVPVGDGKVDIADVTLILRRIIGIGSW